MTLSCPAGGPPNGTVATNPTDAEAVPAVFTVTGFTGNPSCTATESPIPQGYASSGVCSANLIPSTTVSTLQPAGIASCTITNTLRDATLNVYKDFSDKPSNDPTTAHVIVTCPGSATLTWPSTRRLT